MSDAIRTEFGNEGILDNDRLSDEERTALYGAQQALRKILQPDSWHPASQTFYRIGAKLAEAGRTRH